MCLDRTSAKRRDRGRRRGGRGLERSGSRKRGRPQRKTSQCQCSRPGNGGECFYMASVATLSGTYIMLITGEILRILAGSCGFPEKV